MRLKLTPFRLQVCASKNATLWWWYTVSHTHPTVKHPRTFHCLFNLACLCIFSSSWSMVCILGLSANTFSIGNKTCQELENVTVLFADLPCLRLWVAWGKLGRIAAQAEPTKRRDDPDKTEKWDFSPATCSFTIFAELIRKEYVWKEKENNIAQWTTY